MNHTQDYPQVENEEKLEGDAFYFLNPKEEEDRTLKVAYVGPGSMYVDGKATDLQSVFQTFIVYGPIPKPKLPSAW